MRLFYYMMTLLFLLLTGCNNEEPGYGYKSPVVYFARAGVVKQQISQDININLSVYCSGNPKRESIDVSVKAAPELYGEYADAKEYMLLPESAYSPSEWNVNIPKNEQLGLLSISVKTTGIGKGKYVIPLCLTKTSAFELLDGKDIVYLAIEIQ